MNIVFYAPMKPPDHPAPSGDRMMSRLLIRALTDCGHRVTLAPPVCAYEAAGDLQHQQAIHGLAAAAAESFIAASAAMRPDLWFSYHVYHKSPDWIGPAVARALRIPYVIAEASHAAKAANTGWAYGLRGAELAIRSAGLIFSMTALDRAGIAPLLSRRQLQLNLPPFLDTAPYAKLIRTPLAPGQPVRLLAAAMMRPGDKLESYRRLGEYLRRCTQQNWRLTVAGDGPARAGVEQALAPLGAGRINYLGQVEAAQMPGVYADADLFVWPAAGESYGMAMLEAQAAGLPVVAGRGLGVAEVVRDGQTGLLIPDGDGEAFAGVTDILIADAGLRRSMGDAAAQCVRRERSLDAAVQTLTRGLAMLAPRP